MKLLSLSAASVAALAVACGVAFAAANTGDHVVEAERYGAWGVDLTSQKPGAKPGDSFFDYANGGWFERESIPGDQPELSVTYDVYNLSQRQLKALIDGAVESPSTPAEVKIGALYGSFMDEARVEAVGDAPLRADLARIKAVSDKRGMAELMGRTAGAFGGSLFGADVDPHPKDPNSYALFLGQAGLGMPDRDYYLSDNFKAQKAAYRAYAARALAMAGWPDAEAAADAILAYEQKVAEASWPVADRRDRDKTFNPMSPTELAAMAPGFDWAAFLAGAGVGGQGQVIVAEKSAFPKLAAIYAETPLDTLKAWQALQTIDQASPYLAKRYVDSRFEFRLKALAGLQENRPRWKRGATVVGTSLSELVGRQYVDTYFPPKAKAEMESLVGNLKTAMHARIEKLDWMSPQTKAEAFRKLEKMRVRVGYPNSWRSYDGLVIRRDDLYGNMQRSAAFEWAHKAGKLGKPVDKEEWYIPPHEVNAYADATRNVIVFAAGILQPPYFDMNADPAVNYGAIGGVIGHEIIHTFDDQGRKYDSTGVLRDWWTAEDAARFEAQTAKLGAQFDSYEAAPGAFINGKLTMGENLGDLGGLTLALDAYHASLGGKPAPVINGLTGDQRVFLGWAQVWRAKQREDSIKQQVASDPHSPAKFRVDGPVRNLDAWYAAFDVKPGDRLYVKPEDRVRVW